MKKRGIIIQYVSKSLTIAIQQQDVFSGTGMPPDGNIKFGRSTVTVKNFGTDESVVTRNTHIKYESPTCYTIPKLCAKLKFSKCRAKVTVKVTRSNILAPVERSCHNVNTCEI